MKEIGGFLEWETYSGAEYHQEALALNSARNALRFLLRARKIRSIWLPRLLCEVIEEACRAENVEIRYYPVDATLRPVFLPEIARTEWVYLINYYGQYQKSEICEWAEQFHLILDNVQAFYTKPLDGLDTVYTCRKFFGVPDGAYLYTESVLPEELEQDSSCTRLEYLMGRFEHSANAFYGAYQQHEEQLGTLPIRWMSKGTHNLLRTIDYERAKHARENNFAYLHKGFGAVNRLNVRLPEGPYMYPLWLQNGAEIRKRLQTEKIYIPILWPNVLKSLPETEAEHQLAENILPLPVDQRYTENDMKRVLQAVFNCMEETRK